MMFIRRNPANKQTLRSVAMTSASGATFLFETGRIDPRQTFRELTMSLSSVS